MQTVNLFLINHGATLVVLLALMATITAAVPVIQGLGARRSVKSRLRLPEAQHARDTPPHKPGTPAKAASMRRKTAKSDKNEVELRKLQLSLLRAGFFDEGAVQRFLTARIVMAVTVAVASYAFFFWISPMEDTVRALALLIPMTLVGYMLPGRILKSLSNRRHVEYQAGFPDFMDLMVVCADAGLSLEAAMERIAEDLKTAYPALSMNLKITCAEMRAGRELDAALNDLGHRLGLEEVGAFATLLQQSRELGSSITEALRVYSEDMRHKRLSVAEEKAYALPSKLAIPVTLCILPTIMIIALLPVVVRMQHLF